MVLLLVDVRGVKTVVCMLALLIWEVSGYVDEADVAAKDMDCDKLRVAEHESAYTSSAHTAYEKCKKELEMKLHDWVTYSALNAQLSTTEWLNKRAVKYDPDLGSYVLEVRGGRNNSKRYVYFRPDFILDSEDPRKTTSTVFDNTDGIHERYLNLKRQHNLQSK